MGSKRRGKTEKSQRAARLYLAEGLGWLAGYPEHGPSAAMPWRAPAVGGLGWRSLIVDRELLRTSFYTLRGAHRKFPRALPGVVGDVDAWTARTEARLRQIQGAVHDGAPLEAAGGRALPSPSDQVELQAQVDFRAETAWLAWGDPAEQRRISEALSRWRPALRNVLGNLDAPTARRFALEVAADPTFKGSFDPVLTLLSTEDAFSAATQAGEAADVVAVLAVRNLFKTSPLPDLASLAAPNEARSLGAQIVHFLLDEPDPLARELVLQCVPASQSSAWKRWWDAVKICGDEASALLRSPGEGLQKTAANVALAGTVRERAAATQALLPRPVSVPKLHATVRAALGRLPRAAVQAALSCLRHLPDAAPSSRTDKGSFFESATDRLHDLSERRRVELLHGLAARLSSGAGPSLSPAALLHFAAFAAEEMLHFTWSAGQMPWEHRDAVLDAALLIFASPMTDEQREKLQSSWHFAAAFEGYAIEIKDPVRLTEFALREDRLPQWEAATFHATFACARQPAAPGTAAILPFAELAVTSGSSSAAKSWTAASSRDHVGAARLRRLSRSGPLREELRQAAAAAATPHELVRFASLFDRIKRRAPASEELQPPPPGLFQGPEWESLVAWIPDELRDPARRFLAHGTFSGLVKALRPELIDPGSLAGERAALEAKLDSAELTASKRSALHLRLESLAERASAKLSPAETARIAERLHAGAVRHRFQRWLEALQNAALDQLPEAARRAIDFAEDRQADAVMAGLSALSSTQRALGYRLLAARAGPRPWDLRDDPSNLAWREAANAQGLDLTRWFSSAAFEIAPSHEGKTLRFALEDDPLEVMKMGLWFDTCLSPGDMNFFSCLANAADANKRVLVARDQRGVAQARCLLAITEDWHLLAFHVYAHEEGAWVRESARSVVETLCQAIGTRPAPRGIVPTLVAAKWYDDGPTDLTHQLAPLLPEGALTQRLEAAPPSNAFAITSDALGALLVEVALEPILQSRVFQTSPARTASFAPLLTTRRLPRRWAIPIIARLAATEPEVAAGMISQLAKRRSLLRLNLDPYEALALARALRLAGEPSQALRLLRRIQGDYWEEEVRIETDLAKRELGRGERLRE